MLLYLKTGFKMKERNSFWLGGLALFVTIAIRAVSAAQPIGGSIFHNFLNWHLVVKVINQFFQNYIRWHFRRRWWWWWCYCCWWSESWIFYCIENMVNLLTYNTRFLLLVHKKREQSQNTKIGNFGMEGSHVFQFTV